MKYVSLIRVSTRGQENSGLGKDAQRKLIRDYIAKQEIRGPVEEWVETYTGTDKNDDALDKRILMDAIATLEKGDVFIVASRCRVARNVFLIAMVERLVQRKKATFISVQSDNSDTPEAQLQRVIIDAFAQYEAAMISSRTKRALAAKKARGERSGYIPYGQQADKNGKLSFNPEEVRNILRMRQLRKAGLSYRSIAKQLNEEGSTNRKGGAWTHVSVLRLCNNEVN